MAVTTEIPVVDLNRDFTLDDDDVFIRETRLAMEEMPGAENDEMYEQNLESHPKDAMCQTDFPSSKESKNMAARILIPGTTPRAAIRAKSVRKRSSRHSFCWRHDAYEIKNPPARPTSPSSVASFVAGKSDPDQPLEIEFHQGSCSICKAAEHRRLDLKSRIEMANLTKIIAEPSLASVKHCPVNLLQDYIPNCSEFWMENQTFYLGTDADHRVKTSVSTSRRRIRSVPVTTDAGKCYYCLGEHFSSISARNYPSGFCDKHSFRIRSLSLSAKRVTSPCMPKWTKRSQSGCRGWLLVQRVTKKIPEERPQGGSEIKPYYCMFGLQEMIFCLHDLRTVVYIEDICCQHFLQMSRQDALEKGKTVELLFSSQGPVLRDNKHLKGRSLFYFCCHVESAKPKRSSSSARIEVFLRAPDQKLPIAATTDLSKNTGNTFVPNVLAAERRRRRSPPQAENLTSDSGKKTDDSFTVSSGLLNTDKNHLLPFASASPGDKAFASLPPTNSANPSHLPYNQTAGTSIRIDSERKKRTSVSKRSKKEGMLTKYKRVTEEFKKTVTFQDEKENRHCEDKLKVQSSEKLPKRGSLPPPPKLKLTEGEDDTPFVRKRRESVAITFAKPGAKKPEKLLTVNEARNVAVYQQKEWKTVQITVSFKDRRFSKSFLEYKSLQDLYMWLRQELLHEELLTPGAELLLSYENLKFPLKANTATMVLSSLPTTIFICNEIIKLGANDGGHGEATSKYDTRFALPLDIRQLEDLNPVQYLSRYCIVSNTWKAFYLGIFSTHDKLRNRKLKYKDVCAAMERIFVELAHPLLRRVIHLMGLDVSEDDRGTISDHNVNEDWKNSFSICPEEFVSMCSLANRILCREDEIDGFHVNTIKQRDTHLEDADFFNIEGKLQGCNINPVTKRLLLYVRNKPS